MGQRRSGCAHLSTLGSYEASLLRGRFLALRRTVEAASCPQRFGGGLEERSRLAGPCASCGLARLGRGDDLMACLHCNFVGCWAPSKRRSKATEGRHIQAHLLGEHFLAAHVDRLEIFCGKCGDFVFDEHLFARRCRPVPTETPTTSTMKKTKKKKDPVTSDVGCGGWLSTCLRREAPALRLPPLEETGSETDRRAEHGLRGVCNLGNTCFVSCIVQVLVHLAPLQAYFLRGFPKEAGGQTGALLHDVDEHLKRNMGDQQTFCLACEMANVFAHMFAADDGAALVPHRLLYATWRYADKFAGYEQQDAHEFLMVLLDALAKQTTDANGDNVIHQIFRGDLGSYLECSECGHKKRSVEPFLDLSLALNGQHDDRPPGPPGGGDDLKPRSQEGSSGLTDSDDEPGRPATTTTTTARRKNDDKDDTPAAATKRNAEGASVPPEEDFDPRPAKKAKVGPRSGAARSGAARSGSRSGSRSQSGRQPRSGGTWWTDTSSDDDAKGAASSSSRDGPTPPPQNDDSKTTPPAPIGSSSSSKKDDPQQPRRALSPPPPSAAAASTSASARRPATSTKPLKLEDCLARYTSSERLCDDHVCECCGKSAARLKRLTIARLPNVLVVHLKRFDAVRSRKILDGVDFPTSSFDLAPHLLDVDVDADADPDAKVAPHAFHLAGVVNHVGDLARGHYTCFVKEAGRWFSCDDTKVDEVDVDHVHRSEGYILFYVRADLASADAPHTLAPSPEPNAPDADLRSRRSHSATPPPPK